MSKAAQAIQKAFAVRFAEISRWDPNSFHRINWFWPSHVMASIGSVLKPRRDKVDRSANEFSDLMPITIHFDGSIEPRNVSEQREYTMELFWAHPGDIVVSKIDLKNGAVGVIPKEWSNAVLTNHFAVYEPDLSVLDPQYFHLLVQAPFVKEHLWRNKVGAEGRKEVKLDFFESLEIPIPPLHIQRQIVAHYEAARASINVIEDRIAEIDNEIHSKFLSRLDLPRPMRSNPPKCFLSNWKNFKRWSTGYNQAVMSMIDLTSGKYPVVDLGSILELVQYGTSEKANINGIGIPVLRIKNIKDGRIDISELKHVPLEARTLQGLRLVNGDILIIRTSGSRDLVGTCAVFQEEGEFVFASYLIRLRPSSEKALPDYIAWYINSPLGRQQVDSLSRQIMQNNINSQELRILQVPLPPLEVQKEIMGHVEAGRCEIVQQKGNADLLYRQTGIALEEMILGTRPVEAR